MAASRAAPDRLADAGRVHDLGEGFTAAVAEVGAIFRRRMAGLRYRPLSRQEFRAAARALVEDRRCAVRALREERAQARQARKLRRRRSPRAPP